MAWGLKKKEDVFFNLFEQSAKMMLEGAQMFHKFLLSKNVNADKYMKDITDIEHKCDDIQQAIMDKLNQTFITPLDREDIYNIAQEIDDIVDYVHGAVEKMILYKTGEVTEDILELSNILLKASEEILKAMIMVKDMKANFNEILKTCHYIKELESEADYVYRTAVGKLFCGGYDPLYVIKWKEVYKQLEDALDHCEHIAISIRGIALKYS